MAKNDHFLSYQKN